MTARRSNWWKVHFEHITLDSCGERTGGREEGKRGNQLGVGQARDEGTWLRKVMLGWGEVQRFEKNKERDFGRRLGDELDLGGEG